MSASRRERSRRKWSQDRTALAQLQARLQALTGWRRAVVLSAIVLVGVGIIGATSGTAYALSLENHDAFCASCHTEPESKYYQQTLEQGKTTLAVFHAAKDVRCIDCHSGDGMLGRASGLTQGAQDLIAFYSAHYHSPAISLNKPGDGSCTKCHMDTVTRGSFDNHFHLLLTRWQGVDSNAAQCVDCHTSHPTQDPANGYLATSQVQMVCEQCHSVMRN